MLLLHYTGMDNADGALKWLCSPQSEVSAHYFVFEDGRIVQMVPEERRAWHAGSAYWAGETDINSHSIGIEIANPGHAGGSPDFPEDQMTAVVDLCQDIVTRCGIRPARVLAHSDVAPDRKQDPGEKFDWAMLARNGVGLWPDAEPEAAVAASLLPGQSGKKVEQMQERLAAFGYGIRPTGQFDEQTEIIVAAFHLHFRPDFRKIEFDTTSNAILAELLANI